MSLSTSIGGFFVDIAAKVDGSSFDKGEKKIQSIGASMKSLVGSITVTTTALVGMATVAGTVETKNLKLANSIGISAGKLDQWKTAASIAGTNADGLVSSMDALNTKMQGLKTGSVDMNLAKNLGFMGIGYMDFAEMDSDQRMKAVMNKAMGMDDQAKAAKLVGDILGSAGSDYYSYLQLSGKTLEQQMNESKKLIFTDENSKRQAMAFHGEIKGLYASVKSLGTYISSKIAGQLTPIVHKIKEVIAGNRELIKSGISGFVNTLGTALNTVINIFGKMAPFIQRLVQRLGGLDRIIINIGVGIAGLKLAQFAGGIMTVVKSVGMLKAGLAGIGLTALYLLIDDLMVYFRGGKSITGLLMDNMGKLTEKFKDLFPNMDFSFMGDSMQEMRGWIDAVKESSEELKTIWEGIGGVWKEAFGNVIKNEMKGIMDSFLGFVDTLSWILDLVDVMQKEGLSGGWNFIKTSASEKFGKMTDAGRAEYDKALNEGHGKAYAALKASLGFLEEAPLIGTATKNAELTVESIKAVGKASADTAKRIAESGKVISEQKKADDAKKLSVAVEKLIGVVNAGADDGLWDYDKASGKALLKAGVSEEEARSGRVPFGSLDDETRKMLKALPRTEKDYMERNFINGKIEDGIISPNGRITQVSPDDWVIAAKDLGNLASAFLPRGFGNISNSMSSPVVVNQNFSINAGNRELVPAIRQNAYMGTNEALLQNMRNSQRILQQMNGTR